MKLITGLLTLVLALGVIAGCGDDDDDEGGGGGAATPEATEESTETGGGGAGEALTMTADPGGAISWDPTDLTAKAGSVTIKLLNESSVPHAVEVEGSGVEEESETITASETELTIDLEPGEYELYCPVGNHRQQGMDGTLTVE